MAKVQFRVSYSIPDGKRPEYLASVQKLKQFYAGNGAQYAVYESKNKHNHFQEVYIYPSQEAYDQSDDPASISEISGAIERIYALAQDVSYDVSFEVD
ncbi:MAG: hypothetical protein J0I17_04015 ['Candidatus Kapabacteria' thiocyanatum]|uniref:ABM domain-containing protein n=1 Tax=Candidatus Kapaibacterium thiocyanatum TaxID=1895771 RepID=A0A1M3KY49_9BACT|nr:hypothetical protein ['Candidatus Kapabacteria' thiocyanatum]OJX57305.1 MAG: hypothetical protein BGO89_12545 ['Candidatus Kapabacteria' thiocyanatum]